MSKFKTTVILSTLFLCFAQENTTAEAQRLYGGVAVNESSIETIAPRKLSKLAGEKYDKVQEDAPGRDCICFNRNRVELRRIDGRWKLVDGDHWILDFNQNEDYARKAAQVVSFYKMNEICFAGRNTARPMMYFLSDGKAPEGNMEGEDAIPFDLKQIKAEKVEGTWKITCGTLWMLDFGASEQSARDAEQIIKYYGFNKQCFIGRPGPPMEYYTK